MIRILLVVMGLIVYGSLYPWQFRPAPPGVTPFDVLLRSWPAKIGPSDFSDIAVNLLIYIPVGLFAFLALHQRGHRVLRWVLPGLLALALSASLELAQVFDHTRFSSLLDVLDNTLGGLLGTVLGFVFRDSLSGAMFLVFHWVGLQLCVLFTLVTRKAAPRFWYSRLEAITELASWMVFLFLLSEPRRRSRWAMGAAAGFLLLTLIRGLAPFHLAPHARAFSWVPFATLLSQEWMVGLPVYLEKSFQYGAAMWLLRQAGTRLSTAAAVVAGVLASIEAIQRYLPGRTPESTDPILALILGMVMYLIEEAQLPSRNPILGAQESAVTHRV